MKKAFFCEYCGTEVQCHAHSCSSCGRSFMGVRCSRCGKEGHLEDFRKGCPDCGYMARMKPDTSQYEHPLPWSEKKYHSIHLSASRYWILSLLVILGIGLALYFWLQ